MTIDGLEIDRDLEEHLVYLTENPDRIWDDWIYWKPLFGTCSNCTRGCPTMVKNHSASAQTPQLTQFIRNDPRIPTRPTQITKETLPVFAWIQQYVRNYLKNLKNEVNYDV